MHLDDLYGQDDLAISVLWGNSMKPLNCFNGEILSDLGLPGWNLDYLVGSVRHESPR